MKSDGRRRQTTPITPGRLNSRLEVHNRLEFTFKTNNYRPVSSSGAGQTPGKEAYWWICLLIATNLPSNHSIHPRLSRQWPPLRPLQGCDRADSREPLSSWKTRANPPEIRTSSKGPAALLFAGVSREQQAKLEVSPPPTAGRGRGRRLRLEAPRSLRYRGGHLITGHPSSSERSVGPQAGQGDVRLAHRPTKKPWCGMEGWDWTPFRTLFTCAQAGCLESVSTPKVQSLSGNPVFSPRSGDFLAFSILLTLTNLFFSLNCNKIKNK